MKKRKKNYKTTQISEFVQCWACNTHNMNQAAPRGPSVQIQSQFQFDYIVDQQLGCDVT